MKGTGDSFDDLFEGIQIEDVLDREGIEYRAQHGARGEQLNLRECPACGGSEWKVYVNRENGLGNCFHGSCQETFNKYKLTKAVIGAAGGREMRTYLEALAREIGWRPRRSRSVAVEVHTETAWKMPTSIPLPTDDGRNLEYLEKRGISAEIAGFFHLRYCHDGWFNFVKQDGERGGSKFSGRVIIPIFDLAGDLATFQGRDVTGSSDRKYLFPQGLPGTAAYLYNGHTVIGKERVIVCEGAFDVIGAWKALSDSTEWGDVGVVGTFGMHLSLGRDGEDQLAKFLYLKSKGLKEIRIMWDGEPAAWKKAVKAALKLDSLGFAAFVCSLPAGKDPGEADAIEILEALASAIHVTRKSSIKLLLSSPYR